MAKKPPLGIIPRRIFELNRTVDIIEAIHRYIQVGDKIPCSWVEELVELLKRNDLMSGE